MHGLITPRLPPKAELAAGNPVVLQAGEHVKSEYREVVLQPTKNKTNSGRAVWSGIVGGGVELHLYNDVRGNWFLSDTLTPEVSKFIAHFVGGSVAPPAARVWKLAKSMRVASEGGEDWVEGELTLLCGEAGAARAVRGLTQHTCMSACCCGVLRAQCVG